MEIINHIIMVIICTLNLWFIIRRLASSTEWERGAGRRRSLFHVLSRSWSRFQFVSVYIEASQGKPPSMHREPQGDGRKVFLHVLHEVLPSFRRSHMLLSLWCQLSKRNFEISLQVVAVLLCAYSFLMPSFALEGAFQSLEKEPWWHHRLYFFHISA